MAKTGLPEGMRGVIGWALGVGIIAFILLILLIIFGNLSGNVGFSVNTAGYNNTQAVIDNYSISATNTAGQFPVVGTIVGIALLLLVLIGILVFAIVKMMHVAGAAGDRGSNASFG